MPNRSAPIYYLKRQYAAHEALRNTNSATKIFPGARMTVIPDNFQHSVRKNLQGLGILFLAVAEKPITDGGMQRIFDAL